jgi:hypothetical protein
MKSMFGTMALFWLAAFSLSIGLGLISGGVGGAYPPARNIGLPLVCAGQVERTASAFSYKPGQAGISRTTYCVNTATGERTDITLRLVFVAGLIYSAGVFAVLYAFATWLWRKWTRRFAGQPQA